MVMNERGKPAEESNKMNTVAKQKEAKNSWTGSIRSMSARSLSQEDCNNRVTVDYALNNVAGHYKPT